MKTPEPERPIVRCARGSGAAAAHAILKAARRDIPITTADFDSERYSHYVELEYAAQRYGRFNAVVWPI